jgi:hypothetical protein
VWYVTEKVEVLGMLGREMKDAVIGHHYDANESTIYFIKENEHNVRGSTKVSTSTSGKTYC